MAGITQGGLEWDENHPNHPLHYPNPLLIFSYSMPMAEGLERIHVLVWGVRPQSLSYPMINDKIELRSTNGQRS